MNINMKPRDTKQAPSTDLLVCFPSRAHLTLMPKPICSPARPSDPTKRHLKKSAAKGGGGARGHASPMLWSKTKSFATEITEPTSPKVTCAGQIKVRPKTAACRSWQSVMEEIEKIHSHRKQRKKSTWTDSFGFKKEIMQFLTCLRSIRFDLRCFGSFPETETTSEDEEEDEDEVGIDETENEASRTVFSKWFMVLQENQNSGFHREDEKRKGKVGDDVSEVGPSVPPANALLLMRCRSAPAKSWLQENHREAKSEEEGKEKENDEKGGKEKAELKKGRSLKSLMDEEKRKRSESLVVMKYDSDSDYYEISSDIAKETWIVGGISDPLSKSRSWKR